MKIIFGPAVDSEGGGAKELLSNLNIAISFSNEAIELSLTKASEVVYDSDISDLLKKFKYRSIHLPVLNNGGEPIFYPDASLENEIKVIDKYIVDISPNTVLLHPDQIRDAGWLTKKYGQLLAFENMDSRKKFGKTVEDLEAVFNKCPNAKWVFDLNHIYTNDSSMGLAVQFFNKFKNRLVHYHISGYGGFHDALCLSREDAIIKGLLSLNYPIIDEGRIVPKGVLEEEFKYIVDRLSLP